MWSRSCRLAIVAVVALAALGYLAGSAQAQLRRVPPARVRVMPNSTPAQVRIMPNSTMFASPGQSILASQAAYYQALSPYTVPYGLGYNVYPDYLNYGPAYSVPAYSLNNPYVNPYRV